MSSACDATNEATTADSDRGAPPRSASRARSGGRSHWGTPLTSGSVSSSCRPPPTCSHHDLAGDERRTGTRLGSAGLTTRSPTPLSIQIHPDHQGRRGPEIRPAFLQWCTDWRLFWAYETGNISLGAVRGSPAS